MPVCSRSPIKRATFVLRVRFYNINIDFNVFAERTNKLVKTTEFKYNKVHCTKIFFIFYNIVICC